MSTPLAQNHHFSVIDCWAKQQLAPWLSVPMNRDALRTQFLTLAEKHLDVFVYEIRGRQVYVLPAKKVTPPLSPQSPEFNFATRAVLYQLFLRDVLSVVPTDIHCVFAMSMHDTVPYKDGLPWFAFQKPIGSHHLLLPDIDFLSSLYYRDIKPDPIEYRNKKNHAVFVGSTTGARHTVQSVLQLTSERLRTAVFFKDSPNVTFYLPIIAQCVTDEAKTAIENLGVMGRTMTFEEQCQSKFLLSLDGNGATCSRVFRALSSRSVLAKFESNHVLFYFSGLRPHIEYLPIKNPEEIFEFIQIENRWPGYFESVANAGRVFAEQYLNRDGLLRYSATLLQGFGGLQQ